MPVHRSYRVDRGSVRIDKHGWAQHGRGCGPSRHERPWRYRAGLPWEVAEDHALLRGAAMLEREGLIGLRAAGALGYLHRRPMFAMLSRLASIRAGLRVARAEGRVGGRQGPFEA